MIDPDRLIGLLFDHLPRQRWSGAADRQVREVSLEWFELVEADVPALAWTLARTTFVDGSEHRYQLFVGARPAGELPEFLQGKERETLGAVDDLVYYDALVDPVLAVRILHLVDPDREVEMPRPIVLEHSNSSVVFDESLILKLFRRIAPGPNPDVEITRVLAEHGYDHVLAPLAELSRDDTDLAVLREFLVGASEGWHLARNSVRDVLASRMAPEDCGGDFAPEAERLGVIVGGLHVAMAEAWGVEIGEAATWATDMVEHLDELERVHGPLPFDPAAARDRYRRLAELPSPGAAVHIHGDLHLAQVIRADAGWFVLDFEGEPARRRDRRFTVSSPLRDVAGMLRSLHYAAATGLAEWDESDPELGALTVAWEDRNRDVFLEAYLAVEGIDQLLPGDTLHRQRVLGAFELDKAVYELGYELDHRPEWAGIPTSAIERVLGA